MAKGGDFEWFVAKRLSLWLTKGEDKTQLIRSVQSGGWAGKAVSTHPEYQVGDLAPNGPEGEEFRRHFAIECKASGFYPDWWHFLDRSRGWETSVEAWWTKLCEECATHKIGPLLVMKRDNKPIVVGVHSDYTGILRDSGARVLSFWSSTFRFPSVITLDEFLRTDPSVWIRLSASFRLYR